MNSDDAKTAYDFAMKLYGELGRADPWRIFDTTFPQYNPSEFISTRGYRTIDMMRRDEQVKSALSYKKSAVLSTGWQVTSPEGQSKDWEPTVLVMNELQGMQGTLEAKLEEIMLAFEYGFSIGEIIYSKREDGKIGLKGIPVRKPHDIKFRQDIHGNLLGVEQETPDGNIDLPIERLVIFSYQPEFSNPYGRCDLESAYRPWWHKENAYRWMGMYMERLGIPPVFALYNPDVYNSDNFDALKTVINRIQAGTVGILPRRSPEDLEMWAPELSQGVASVFLPALDKFDSHIARAILMPSQLGVSPETSVGSQARATIIFDLFLYLINSIRKTIAETIMQEQVVKRLVDLNFADVEEYPLFTFLPLKEEAKPELFTTWLSLVNGGIATPTEQDEVHIRKALEFPEREETDKDVREGGPHDPNVRLDMEKKALEDRKKKVNLTQEIHLAQKTIDIKRELDSLENSFNDDIVQLVDEAMNKVVLGVAKTKNPQPKHALEIEIPYESRLMQIMYSHMIKAFESGIASMRGELNGGTVKDFDIRQALDSTLSWVKQIIRTRAIFYSKNLINDLRITARQALLTGISNGEHETTIAERIRSAYRRFWGEDIEHHRARTIARTEGTYAWNQGRLSEAKKPQYKGLVTGWRYSSVLDGVTTPVCRHMHNKIIKDSDPMLPRLRPPNHYNCRSILEPMTITKKLKESDYISEADKATGLSLAMDGFT